MLSARSTDELLTEGRQLLCGTAEWNPSCTSASREPAKRMASSSSNLKTARACLEAGDRARALQAVDAALEIDPNFLAAHSLRERILSASAEPRPHATTTRRTPSVRRSSRPGAREKKGEAAARRPGARRGTGGDHRGRLRDASAALDEVIELDPNSLELKDLAAKLDVLRRGRPPSSRSRWLPAVAAVAAFGGIRSGPLYVWPGILLMSLPGMEATRARLCPNRSRRGPWARCRRRGPISDGPVTGRNRAVPPAPRVMATRLQRPGRGQAQASRASFHRTAGGLAPAPGCPSLGSRVALASPASGYPSGSGRHAAIPELSTRPSTSVDTPGRQRPRPRLLVPPAATAVTAGGRAAASAHRLWFRDARREELVKDVLHRYRRAYDGLDARSARAVWPKVDEPALARAFDGLRSQKLTFKECDLSVSDDKAASATCHGTARYVPKVGSAEPRVEPRVWSFTLRKNGPEWQIQSVRAERRLASQSHSRARQTA